MSPLAEYQSACQPQTPPPIQRRTKNGDSLKVRPLLFAMMTLLLTCVVCLENNTIAWLWILEQS